jgi:hypothetical protein
MSSKASSGASSSSAFFKKQFFSTKYELITNTGKLINVTTASHISISFGDITTNTKNSQMYANIDQAVVVRKTEIKELFLK